MSKKNRRKKVKAVFVAGRSRGMGGGTGREWLKTRPAPPQSGVARREISPEPHK